MARDADPREEPREDPRAETDTTGIARADVRTSGMRSRRPGASTLPPTNAVATVDEVVADMTKDPRRERDE
jgi:hypothetical protein